MPETRTHREKTRYRGSEGYSRFHGCKAGRAQACKWGLASDLCSPGSIQDWMKKTETRLSWDTTTQRSSVMPGLPTDDYDALASPAIQTMAIVLGRHKSTYLLWFRSIPSFSGATTRTNSSEFRTTRPQQHDSSDFLYEIGHFGPNCDFLPQTFRMSPLWITKILSYE
jgi:hypothetical protein